MDTPKGPLKTIGVLALQGDISEHLRALGRIQGVRTRRVLQAEDLEGLSGLIIPGGESTAVGTILSTDPRGMVLRQTLVDRIKGGLPVWGTCMGAILLAATLDNDHRTHLAVMDIHVVRNAYGSQLDSFETAEPIEGIEGGPFPLVFIRAPVISQVGPGVRVLARHGKWIVACQQGTMVATTFHPELTEDDRFHRYFVSLCGS